MWIWSDCWLKSTLNSIVGLAVIHFFFFLIRFWDITYSTVAPDHFMITVLSCHVTLCFFFSTFVWYVRPTLSASYQISHYSMLIKCHSMLTCCQCHRTTSNIKVWIYCHSFVLLSWHDLTERQKIRCTIQCFCGWQLKLVTV